MECGEAGTALGGGVSDMEVFNNTDTESSSKAGSTRSSLLSLFRSARPTENAWLPSDRKLAAPKVPPPVPRSTDTTFSVAMCNHQISPAISIEITDGYRRRLCE